MNSNQNFKITIIYFNICYNNVKRYGKRFLSRIFADNFISTLTDSTLKCNNFITILIQSSMNRKDKYHKYNDKSF
jgi:hypothetical protein